MNDQMMRVISSPSSSTIGFLTWICSAMGAAMLPAAAFPARRESPWPHATINSMATVERHSGSTHEVFNQPPPLEDYNSFDADRVLGEALRREGAGWAEEQARELG